MTNLAMGSLFVVLVVCPIFTTPSRPGPNQYLPNLRVPANVMTVNMFIRAVGGKTYLNISFGGANVGPGHLVVIGDRDLTKNIWNARQVVCNSNAEWNVLPHKAGFYHFQDLHNHLHWNVWAQYGLINFHTGQITKSRKNSFSLLNSRPAKLRLPAPGQPLHAPTPLWITNLATFYPMRAYRMKEKIGQTISAGYMDIYSTRANEPIPFDGDGSYLLVGMVDPDHLIKEWNEHDNYSAVFLKITGTSFKVLGYWESL